MKFTFPPESTPLEGFTIKRAIHRGGFGEVYYAMTDAGKEVALKLLYHNLEVELRGVSQCLNLSHPNLVTIFDIKQDKDNDHWIVMEFVSGQGLDKIIDKHPNGMPLPLVDHWLHGMANGLAYLHDRGIVHRDLKPANVYSDDSAVKLGDVGLSKFISESRRSAHTQSVGTVYYMAPEVARGKYGREVDVYGMGVVLFEMLTGGVPFVGETTAEILMKHLSERPNLDAVPPEFRPVIAKALEKDPQQRIPDVPTLVAMYDAARNGQASSFVVNQHTPNAAAAPAGAIPAAVVAPPEAVGFSAGAGTAGTGSVQWLNEFKRLPTPVRWGMAGLAMVMVLRNPAMTEIAIGGAMLGAVGWLVYKAFKGVTGSPKTDLSPNAQRQLAKTVRTAQQDRPATGPHAVRPDGRPIGGSMQFVNYPRTFNPDTARKISFRQRLTELTGSMTMAVLCTTLITGGLYMVADFLKEPAAVGQFALTTLIASWAIILVSKFREGTGAGGHMRRLVFVAAGIMVGFLAYGMDQQLLLNLTGIEDLGSKGLFASVGRQPLMDFNKQPTLAAYVIFFAGLFGLRRWWWHADSFRRSRLKVSTALLTLMLGYGLTIVFSFPNVWGMMWALAISAVVQLSSVWTPRDDRKQQMASQQGVV
ncbi:serine/threonine protein kinase [bacterium]|nr:serine/threonine protein kinase [bacterium]